MVPAGSNFTKHLLSLRVSRTCLHFSIIHIHFTNIDIHFTIIHIHFDVIHIKKVLNLDVFFSKRWDKILVFSLYPRASPDVIQLDEGWPSHCPGAKNAREDF